MNRLLATSLASLLALAILVPAGSAAATRQPAPAAGGPACSAASASPMATTSVIKVKLVAGFLAARLAERGVNMGFDYLLKVSGASTAESRNVARLNAIREQLNGINSRLNAVMGAVGNLINERREAAFDQELRRLCGVANQQRAALRRYDAAIRAGVELGRILEQPNGAQLADQVAPDARVSPRQRAVDRANEFIEYYRNNVASLEGGIDQLHTALIPESQVRTALALYGDVLMTNRWVRRSDSKRIRALYAELAEIRALASWMAAEYWAAIHDDGVEVDRVLDQYESDLKRTKRNLPRMIPAGVVIDAGSTKARTVNRKPMWFAPTAKDLGWVPTQMSHHPRPESREIGVDEVGEELRALNKKPRLGAGWKAPTRQEFEALVSTECAADPADPKRFLRDGHCQNAVGSNSSVARYLAAINPAKNWQRLFCLGGGGVSCPPDSGPLATGPRPRHLFVWTDEVHSQRVECGRTDVPRVTFWHRFLTYTGFRTLTDSAVHALFPHLPRRSPLYRVQARQLSLRQCDLYFGRLIYGSPVGTPPRNHLVEGVLLATRFSGKQDLSPSGRIDYMGQTVATK